MTPAKAGKIYFNCIGIEAILTYLLYMLTGVLAFFEFIKKPIITIYHALCCFFFYRCCLYSAWGDPLAVRIFNDDDILPPALAERLSVQKYTLMFASTGLEALESPKLKQPLLQAVRGCFGSHSIWFISMFYKIVNPLLRLVFNHIGLID